MTDGDEGSWFEEAVGVTELEFLAQRGELLVETAGADASFGPRLSIKHARTGELHDAVAFRVWSLDELSVELAARPAAAPTEPPTEPPIFDIRTRRGRGAAGLALVEVSAMQAAAEDGTLFVVASNFNCLEVPNQRSAPDRGRAPRRLATPADPLRDQRQTPRRATPLDFFIFL
mmetsp:Transcript_40717/g.95899  ORF Transcript_40717/g.95899 Transcript_40717/m.95899 type:complete len:174 (+) Transcript_40717:65-586(+)